MTAWRAVLIVCVMLLAAGWYASGSAADPAAEVAAVLDAFHQAAAKADGPRYFACLADDAVFLGTDASERWTKAEFEKFCAPYFNKGIGWKYVPRDRHFKLAPGGQVAWFDELLDNAKYGTCRGSGVLVRTAAGWKITQYNLSIPIPNAIAADIVQRIRAAEKKP